MFLSNIHLWEVEDCSKVSTSIMFTVSTLLVSFSSISILKSSETVENASFYLSYQSLVEHWTRSTDMKYCYHWSGIVRMLLLLSCSIFFEHQPIPALDRVIRHKPSQNYHQLTSFLCYVTKRRNDMLLE